MVAVAFYAGLNLIAWFMIFCFVRETKQLTLEELDRKSSRASMRSRSLTPRRGFFGTDKSIYFSRNDCMATIFYQASYLAKEGREAARHHRKGRQVDEGVIRCEKSFTVIQRIRYTCYTSVVQIHG